MEPYRQWSRENLPSSREGCTIAGDDGFLRMFTADDPLGIVIPWEWKTWGASCDVPTRKTFDAVMRQRIGDPLVIRLVGGNVPGSLLHYPESCSCGLPEQPKVANAIFVNGVDVVDGAGLRLFVMDALRFANQQQPA